MTDNMVRKVYTELALWSDAYHQQNGPIVAAPNDSGVIFDPDLPSAHWLTSMVDCGCGVQPHLLWCDHGK